MATFDDALRVAFAAASRDARLQRPASLWIFRPESNTFGQKALLYPEHGEYRHGESEVEKQALNDALFCDHHRIGLWRGDKPLEICIALMRHELEHARQLEDIGSDFECLSMITYNVLQFHPDAQTERGGALYQTIPVEIEANAATAHYMRGLLAPEAYESLVQTNPGYRSLLTQEAPGGTANLLERMVLFLAGFPDECHRYAAQWPGPPRFASLLPSASRAVWHAHVGA